LGRSVALGAALAAGVALAVVYSSFVAARHPLKPDERSPLLGLLAATPEPEEMTAAPGPLAPPSLTSLTESPEVAATPVALAPSPEIAAAPGPEPEPEGIASAAATAPAPPTPESSPAPSSTASGPPAPIDTVVEDELRTGDTLSSSLLAHGISAATVAVIERELRPYFDFRHAHPGHRFRLVAGANGSLVSFHYRVSEKERYWLEADAEGWKAWRADAAAVRRRARIAGTIATTLFDAVRDLGESPQLASDFAGIFAWDVDFAKSAHAGDEFRILYERNYAPRADGGVERYLGPGRILAARYKSTGGEELSAVYYETEPGHGAYYRVDGRSVKQTFLAAPLSFSRISSTFTQARLHPILGVWRPHPGIDYAAPIGTPIWSVGDGRVAFMGWAGGYGRLVKIEHASGYESYYAHLSRFAPGLAPGKSVHQKQVIGYVGMSGLATGPHVCFRVTRDGSYVDPAKVRMPSGAAIPARERQDFETVRDHLLASLRPASIAATDEAM
jgi:murein DD-endopeptidase MepM/ murein hydrolase activator NlpD